MNDWIRFRDRCRKLFLERGWKDRLPEDIKATALQRAREIVERLEAQTTEQTEAQLQDVLALHKKLDSATMAIQANDYEELMRLHIEVSRLNPKTPF